MRELEALPLEQINEWMAEYMIRDEEMEEARLAAKAEQGLQGVKRSLSPH